MSLKRGKLIGLAAIIAMASPFTQPLNAVGEVFELSSLSNLYEGVSFDHDMHIEAASDNCAACHHHTAGTPTQDPNCIPCHKNSGEAESAACSSCHEAEPFTSANLEKTANTPYLHHKEKPGLMAALHQNCLGCHSEVGGPLGCQDCHTMTDKGEKYYNTGKYAPKPGKETDHH